MKIAVSCATCLREFTDACQRGEAPDTPPPFLPGELHDSGSVFVTCSNGHQTAVLYNHQRHEVLFISGTAAIKDGYTNEAVSTMAAALERPCEFFFRVIFRKRSLDVELTDAAWKLLSHQSERQFGAFGVLWTLETRSHTAGFHRERQKVGNLHASHSFHRLALRRISRNHAAKERVALDSGSSGS